MPVTILFSYDKIDFAEYLQRYSENRRLLLDLYCNGTFNCLRSLEGFSLKIDLFIYNKLNYKLEISSFIPVSCQWRWHLTHIVDILRGFVPRVKIIEYFSWLL